MDLVSRTWSRTSLLLCVLAATSGSACSDADSGDPMSYAGDAGGETDADVRHIERSGLTDVGTSGRLDYAKAEHWVCRPDIEPNECERDLSATEIKADGSFEVHEHVAATDPQFDCFYVYPTVWLNQQTPQMTNFSDEGVKLVLDPLLSQGARFNRVCRVYAPLYRQAGLVGAFIPEGASKDLALQDVRDAFAYYLEHDNHGRKFVLIGHSQGTFMLSSLIARDIDENAALRAQMISALLIGGQPYTPPGEAVGGSFKNVRACTDKGQTGCVIAYNSFAQEAPPGSNAIVGRVGTELANEEVDLNGQVMCVEPAAMGFGGTRYAGSYFALSLNNPQFGTSPARPEGIDTPFVLYRDFFHGECKQKDGLSWLEISVDRQSGDDRTAPMYRTAVIEAIGFGLHLVDYNFALDDLIEAVSVQAKAALK